ncbi:hypothetical protein RYX36_010589 [Vicia faba]
MHDKFKSASSQAMYFNRIPLLRKAPHLGSYLDSLQAPRFISRSASGVTFRTLHLGSNLSRLRGVAVAIPTGRRRNPPFSTMVKIEELNEPVAKTNRKRNHGSTSFFVFVDYFFILMFLAFLCFIIFEIIGV